MPPRARPVRAGVRAAETLARLNLAQRRAVTHEGGPLLVIAGAGTGKTAVITERIAWLIRERGYRPDSILALTFTNKAATEMEERVDRLLPMGTTQVWVETFHSFCERVLREKGLEIGLDPSFRVLSVPREWLLVRRHLYALPLTYFRPLGNPTKFLRAVIRAIGAAKDQDLPPERFDAYAVELEEAAERAADATARDAKREQAVRWREFAAITRAVQALLLKESALDFGDLILATLRLLRERPSVLRELRERFRAVLVDEFQDTNGAQNELLRLLVGEQGKGITVVGDDDQSIYAWRGSNITNILRFQQAYPQVRKLVLTENYRSPQDILNAAYRLIQHNNPFRLEETAGVVKKLTSAREFPGSRERRVSHHQFSAVELESKFIAETILALVRDGVCQYRDCAVLLRTNAQADDIVPSLVQRDIPYHVAEARGLLLRPEIRDVAAYLRAIVNPDNALPLFRLLSLGVFGVDPLERQRLLAEAKRRNLPLLEVLRDLLVRQHLSRESRDGIETLLILLTGDIARAGSVLPSTVVLEFLHKSGVLESLLKDDRRAAEAVPNLTEFVRFAEEYERGEPEGSLLGFVEYLDLVTASGESPAQAVLPPDVDAVRLLTVHGAKGLEFPVVFIPGATKDKYPVRDQQEPLALPDLFAPHEGLDPRDAHVLEERRLFYVAITRARERLFITSAERSGSQKTSRKPSPFIAEAGIETLPSGVGETAVQQLLFAVPQAPPPVAPSTTLTLPTSISVSQIEAYETCPLQYQFRYVYRVPVPPSHALTFGTTIHAVLRNLARSVVLGKTPTSEDVATLYDRHWSSEGFTDRQQEREQREFGRTLLAQYLDAHPELLTRAPLFVEEPFRFRLKDTTVVGRIDRVDKSPDGAVSVTDFKTGRAKDQQNADTSLQLSVYALALQEAFHLHADHLTLSYLEGNVDLRTTRSQGALAEAKKRVLDAMAKIRARDFAAKPSYNACHFCDFRTVCDFSVV